MAWSLVQSKTAGVADPGDGAPTITLDSTATANNLLVWACAPRENQAAHIAPPSGFSVAKEQDSSFGVVVIYYKVAAGGEQTIATTITNEDANWAVVCAEYSGNATSSPLDVTDGASSGSPSVGTLTSGTTEALAEAASLGIVAFNNQGGTSAYSFDQGYGLVGHALSSGGAGSNRASCALGENLSVGTAAEESTASWTTNRRSSGAIATFKPAAAGVAPFDLIAKKTGTALPAPLRILSSHLIRAEVVVLPPVKLIPLQTGTAVEIPRPPQTVLIRPEVVVAPPAEELPAVHRTGTPAEIPAPPQTTLLRPEVIPPLVALPPDHLVHLTGTDPELPRPLQTVITRPEVIPPLTALPLDRLVHHTGTDPELPRPLETILSQPEVIPPLTALPPSQLFHRTGTAPELAPPPVTIFVRPEVIAVVVEELPAVHRTGTAIEVPPPPVTTFFRPEVIPPLTALPPEYLVLRTGTAPELPLPPVSVFTRPDFIPLPVITLPGLLRTGTALIIPLPPITRFVPTVFLPVTTQPSSVTGKSFGTLVVDRGIDLGTSTSGKSPVSAKTGKSPSSL